MKPPGKPTTVSPTSIKAAVSAPSWMMRGENRIAATTKKIQEEAKSFGVPRFWVIDGETKQVRFCSNEPLAAIFQYRVRVRGKWRNITQPGTGENDPCAEAGLMPQYRIIFEIIDVTGYLDQKTKRQVRNIRRFWEISPKIWEQIQKIRTKYGPLTTYNVEVSRSGEGPQTTYTFMPEPKTPMPVAKDKPLAPDLATFFKPLSEEKMRNLVAGSAQDDSED